MGGATSVLAGYTCHACSMNFSIDANGERAAAEGGVLCPQCNRPAERRAAQITGSPQLFVTPSGLVMTEDTLRQLLVAQLSPAPGAQPEQMHSAIDAMLRGLRQARDGEGMDTGLFEAINRSLSEAQSQQAPPAAAKAVDALPRHKWAAGQKGLRGSDECAICLSAYEEGDDMCVLPCKHELHVDCLMPWLKQTNSCPLCRHQLSTDCADYEERRGNEQREQRADRVGRPSPIRTDAPSSTGRTPRSIGGRPGTGLRGSTTAEFGVHAPTSSPSNASGGSSATSSPATRTRQYMEGGMRRGFLQDRGGRGFGEDRSPQQAGDVERKEIYTWGGHACTLSVDMHRKRQLGPAASALLLGPGRYLQSCVRGMVWAVAPSSPKNCSVSKPLPARGPVSPASGGNIGSCSVQPARYEY